MKYQSETAVIIALNTNYVRYFNHAITGMLLSQIVYWTKIMSGKFYKSDADFAKELGISKRQLTTAKEKLYSQGFIAITREGRDGITHYNLDKKALDKAIQDCDTCPETFKGTSKSKVEVKVDQEIRKTVVKTVIKNKTVLQDDTKCINDELNKCKDKHGIKAVESVVENTLAKGARISNMRSYVISLVTAYNEGRLTESRKVDTTPSPSYEEIRKAQMKRKKDDDKRAAESVKRCFGQLNLS